MKFQSLPGLFSLRSELVEFVLISSGIVEFLGGLHEFLGNSEKTTTENL